MKKNKTFLKHLIFFLIVLSIFISIPMMVKAYEGPPIKCFGECPQWGGECGNETLVCQDNQPGYNVYCKGTGHNCGAYYWDPCQREKEECGYLPITCNDIDCGSDYWDGYRCLGQTVQAKYVDRGCFYRQILPCQVIFPQKKQVLFGLISILLKQSLQI